MSNLTQHANRAKWVIIAGVAAASLSLNGCESGEDHGGSFSGGGSGTSDTDGRGGAPDQRPLGSATGADTKRDSGTERIGNDGLDSGGLSADSGDI